VLTTAGSGKADVMESWKVVLAGAKRGLLTVSISDIRTVASDTQALITCVETVEAGDSRGRVIATNGFEKQNGRWKIIHHHGSGIPF
jgi:translation initiation factor 2A